MVSATDAIISWRTGSRLPVLDWQPTGLADWLPVMGTELRCTSDCLWWLACLFKGEGLGTGSRQSLEQNIALKWSSTNASTEFLKMVETHRPHIEGPKP